MENSLINKEEVTEWYENDQPLQEYLNRSRKPANAMQDLQAETSSWLKMMKNPRSNSLGRISGKNDLTEIQVL